MLSQDKTQPVCSGKVKPLSLGMDSLKAVGAMGLLKVSSISVLRRDRVGRNRYTEEECCP